MQNGNLAFWDKLSLRPNIVYCKTRPVHLADISVLRNKIISMHIPCGICNIFCWLKIILFIIFVTNQMIFLYYLESIKTSENMWFRIHCIANLDDIIHCLWQQLRAMHASSHRLNIPWIVARKERICHWMGKHKSILSFETLCLTYSLPNYRDKSKKCCTCIR